MANPLRTLMDIILRRSSRRSSALPTENRRGVRRRDGAALPVVPLVPVEDDYDLDEPGGGSADAGAALRREGSADAGAALRREGYGLDERGEGSADAGAALRREGYGLDEHGGGSAEAGAALRREGYGLDESDPDEEQSTLILLRPMETPELVTAGDGESFQLEDDGDIDIDSDDGGDDEEIDV